MTMTMMVSIAFASIMLGVSVKKSLPIKVSFFILGGILLIISYFLHFMPESLAFLTVGGGLIYSASFVKLSLMAAIGFILKKIGGRFGVVGGLFLLFILFVISYKIYDIILSSFI